VQINPDESRIFVPAGERIWINITGLIRNPVGNRMLGGAFGFIEPSVGQILKPLAADPRLGAGTGKLKLDTARRVAGFFFPVIVHAVHSLRHPEQARQEFDRAIDEYLGNARIAPGQDRFQRLANIVAFMRARMAHVFQFLLPRFISLFGPGMASLNLLNHLIRSQEKNHHGFSMRVLETTRGLPQNVTTEMDLALWEASRDINSDAESSELFATSDAPALARRYLEGTLPAAAQNAVASFMGRYGMRGVGEIDIGQPRWREDPTPVMQTLQSYLQIDADSAPDVLFARGQQAAQTAMGG
jgi:pyruvate,water dikinase